MPTRLPKKLKNVDHLRALLEILNENPDRYVPLSELKIKFKEKLDPDNELADGVLDNSLNNTLSFAVGINDKVGRPKFDTPAYLADIAQIWQTKLIEDEQFTIEGKKEWRYMIKIKGIEVLNQLELNKNIVSFNQSSDRASRSIGILTIFLVALAAIQILLFINSQPLLAPFIIPTEVVLGFIILGVMVVEKDMLFTSGNKRIAQNENGEKTKRSGISILIIGSIITLGLILGLWALFKYDNWSAATIQETIIGVIVAYALFVYGLILKDLILPIQTKLFAWLEKGCMKDWKKGDKKRRLILVPIAVFLRAIPIIVVIAWVALDFASAGVTQTVTYEVLGGITGAWALGLFFKDFGINPE